MIKYLAGVAIGVLVVEILLAVFFAPVANLAIFGGLIFATAFVGGVLFLAGRSLKNSNRALELAYQDRQAERQSRDQADQRTHETHRQTVQVMGVLSARQQMIIDRLISEGAELRRTRSGDLVAVKGDLVAPVTPDQAKYWLEAEKEGR